MNAQVKGRVFKSGNSVAVRLPKAFGFKDGAEIILEQQGAKVTIVPADDPEEERLRVLAMLERIDAIWAAAGGPPAGPQQRDTDIFPDRPGLY